VEFYCEYFTTHIDELDEILPVNNPSELKCKIRELRESGCPSKATLAYVLETYREMYDAGYELELIYKNNSNINELKIKKRNN
jgi:DNA polymerase III alpha subunit (gram-positive type)